MDVASEILNNIAAKNRVTGLLRLRGDWAFQSPQAEEAVFHLVFKGSLHITFRGETVRLEQGDMAMFAKGHEHVLASAPEAPMVTFAENDTRVRMHGVDGGEVCSIDKQAEGAETSVICARFNFNSQTAHDLVRHFPDKAVLQGLGADSFAAFEPLLHRAAKQAHSDEMGALAELDSLVNLLYLSFMRRWLMQSSPSQPGWMKGLQDPYIAKALQLMHASPAYTWSVQELATQVAMSRSSFAARFAQVTGESPLRYLMRWRMVLAAQQLETEPDQPISNVAYSVGYDSVASFSASFKRHFGQPPGAWREGLALDAQPAMSGA